MRAVNSAAQVIAGDVPVYMTSESRDSKYEWGQPPASHYFFMITGETLQGQLISGVYFAAQDIPDVIPWDSKDALMEDSQALRALYAEFAQEDIQLAQLGSTHYARMLQQEESQA